MLVVEGLCSLGSATATQAVTVTCKTGTNDYKKHFLGLSDNVSYFAEQIKSQEVSKYNYKVIFKPKSIIPDIDLVN